MLDNPEGQTWPVIFVNSRREFASFAIRFHGWSQRRMARELGIDRETVARYAQQLRAAEAKPAIVHTGSDPGPNPKPAIVHTGSDPGPNPKPAIVHTGSEGADPLLAGLLPPD